MNILFLLKFHYLYTESYEPIYMPDSLLLFHILNFTKIPSGLVNPFSKNYSHLTNFYNIELQLASTIFRELVETFLYTVLEQTYLSHIVSLSKAL